MLKKNNNCIPKIQTKIRETKKKIGMKSGRFFIGILNGLEIFNDFNTCRKIGICLIELSTDNKTI